VGLAADYVSPRLHRLFGDVNGSKSVNAADYNTLRQSFGKTSGDPSYQSAFDFDESGVVNAADYNQFRARFGRTFVYT
jgi:hypothetical protein